MPPLTILSVDPESKIAFEPSGDGASHARITLVNTIALPIAFKVKSTASKSYAIKPSSGYIERNSAVEVDLVRRALEDGDDASGGKKKPDRFLLQAAVVDTEEKQLLINAANPGKANGLSKFWDGVAKDALEERQLEVVETVGHVKANGEVQGHHQGKGGRGGGAATPAGARGIVEVPQRPAPKKTIHRRKEDIVLQKHSRPVTHVATDPAGKVLFTCGKDKLVLGWSLPDGEFLGTYEGHRGAIWACSVSPDGQLLLSCGADNMVILWQVYPPLKLSEVHTAGVARCVEWLPRAGAKRFVVCSNSFAKKPAALGIYEVPLGGKGGCVDPSTQGRLEASLLVMVEEPILPSAAAQVAWAGSSCEFVCSVHSSGEVLFWEATSGVLGGRLQAHQGLVSQVAFPRHRGLMASCGREDMEVRLWDLRRGVGARHVQLVRSFKADRALNAVALRQSLTPEEAAAPSIGGGCTCDCLVGGGQDARDVALVGSGTDDQFEPVCLRFGANMTLEDLVDDEFEEPRCKKGGGHFGPIHTLLLWPNGELCVSGSEDGNVRLRELTLGSTVSVAPEALQRRNPPSPTPGPQLAGGTGLGSAGIRAVALYDFDPLLAGWPPASPHKAMSLRRGQEVVVLREVGGGWALGCSVSSPEAQGIIPINYAMPFSRYNELMMSVKARGEEQPLAKAPVQNLILSTSLDFDQPPVTFCNQGTGLCDLGSVQVRHGLGLSLSTGLGLDDNTPDEDDGDCAQS